MAAGRPFNPFDVVVISDAMLCTAGLVWAGHKGDATNDLFDDDNNDGCW